MASIVVTTLADTVANDGQTSLREAIDQANGTADADTITFQSGLSGTIALTTQFIPTGTLTIDGDTNGDDKADITLSGQDATRHFTVYGGADLTLKSLNLTEGLGTRNTPGPIEADFGASIIVLDSTLTIEDSRLYDNNSATTTIFLYDNIVIPIFPEGGAIYARGSTYSLRDVTLDGNSAGEGGGLYARNSAGSLENVTITENVVTVGTSNAGSGVSLNGGSLNMLNSTVSGNAGSPQLEIHQNTSGTISNSVFADGTAANDFSIGIGGSSVQFSGNFIENGSVGDGNINNGGSPLLGVLTNNGGTTLTMLPTASSPLVNAGSNANVPSGLTEAANGVARIQGQTVDIGAAETNIEAKSLIVTTTLDVVDATDGKTSLREAVAFANSKANVDANTPDVITFNANVFKGGPDSLIRLTQGEITITDAVTIDGSTGIGVTITGDKSGDDKLVSGTFITDVKASYGGTAGAADDFLDDNSRIFNITSNNADTTLQSLTLTGGHTTVGAQNGGAVRSLGALALTNSTVSGNSTAGPLANGGGIFGNASVTLTNSTVSGNSTAANTADGGGIYGKSFVTLTNSTVSANATAGNFSDGGGIYGSTVTLTNSTVSGNSTHGSNSHGGGIGSNDSITLTNSTVSGNATAGGDALGGGIFGASSVTLTNSIVLGNESAQTTADEVFSNSSLITNGGNIVGGTVYSGSTPISATTAAGVFAQTVANGAATAGVLANNGGPVQTIALLASATNPALDASSGSTSTTGANGVGAADQTGIGNEGIGPTVRDLGAYEAPDFVKPTVTIDVADTSLTIGETTTVTFTFSEKVTKFENSDLTIENGSLTDVASSDGGLTWTATFTPTANIEDASNAISLDLSKVEDLAGNAGTGTQSSNTYAIDTIRPTVTIAVADASLTVGETSLVTFTFSEKVTKFDNGDLAIDNGSLTDVASNDGGKTWTATFTPTANIEAASNIILLDLSMVEDLAGNAGTGSETSKVYAIDTLRPTVTIVVADAALADGETSLVTFTFSEKVTNFDDGDLTIENGSVSNLQTSDGGKTWTATFTQTAGVVDQSNVITLNLAGVKDFSGNAGTGTAQSNTYALLDDAPTATDLDQTLTINEDAAPTKLFAIAPTVQDVDSSSVTATLTLANSSAGVLVGGGFTATSTAGVYTFSGSASQVAAALAAVTFNSADNFNGSTSVSVAISDGNLSGPTGSVAINVTSVNDAPSGANKTITTDEDKAYTFNAADFGFSDVDGNSLAAVKITQLPGAGTLKLGNAVVSVGQVITAGSLSGLIFTPTANANGANFASIKFQVQDDGSTDFGGVDTDASANTITFNVAAVTDAPTAVVASNVRGPIAENASTASAIKFADLDISDVDGGTNVLSLSGADATLFQILNGDLYLKAGAKLDFETNPKLDVTVIVNDASVGGAIDAQTKLSFSVTDIIESYIGNGSANTFAGTASDETFIGNGGADKMTGGGGRDTFVFKALTDTAAGSPSFITNPTIAWQSGLGLRDVITDFTPGFDKIDLSLIDASTKLSGNQAFSFLGTGNFSSSPGSIIYRVFDLAGTANDRTIVYADVNGDRLADMQIELTGLKTLQATDFVL